MKTLASALLAGLLFGTGLIVSGMSDPSKVLGFLDIGGLWDPSLAFVMGGAIAVGLASWLLGARWRREGHPSLLGPALPPPRAPQVDRRLVLGSATFGVGWGLVGICPGPAVVIAGAAHAAGLVFLAAMLAGMLVYSLLQRPLATGPSAATG